MCATQRLLPVEEKSLGHRLSSIDIHYVCMLAIGVPSLYVYALYFLMYLLLCILFKN